jgi:hypothetical protein
MQNHNFISNEKQLKIYLLKEKNSYCNFILDKINNKCKTLIKSMTHIHHIIPRHFNGPDSD